jgi:D-lyxose ketol-isomerase
MITRDEQRQAVIEAVALLRLSGVVLRDEEISHMEVADFGLGELAQVGLQILPLVSTGHIAVKLLVLRPWQACPQHRHPPVGDYAGKEETFRAQWGKAYLCVPGEPTPAPRACPPAHHRQYYTVWHEVVLRPGEQYTSAPNEWHWFQGGPQGAVLWSYASHSTDMHDIFAHPGAARCTVVSDDGAPTNALQRCA